MNSMIWKELRENLLWALLMLFASVSIIVAFMSSEFDGRLQFRILAEEIPAIFTLMSGVAAVVLGLLQTIPELWRDRWGFLVHRGMSTGKIFLAKATAALLIYLTVIGVPLMIAISWAALTGFEHFPFEWRMGVPSIVAAIAGFGFYFAVYHIILRERGFPLWRLLPVSIPITAVALHHGIFFTNHFAFWSAIVPVVLLTLLSGLLAYRTMASHGAMQDFGSTAGRVLIGTNFLTLMFLLGGGLGCAWAAFDVIYEDVLGYGHSIYQPQSRIYTNQWVDRDGDVIESETGYSANYVKDMGHAIALHSIRNMSDPNSSKYSEFVGQKDFWKGWEEKLPRLATAHSRPHFWTAVGRPAETKFYQELEGLGPKHSSRTPALAAELKSPLNSSTPSARKLTWHLSTTHGVILGYTQPRLRMAEGNRRVWLPPILEMVIGPDGYFEYPAWPRQRFGKCLASAYDFADRSLSERTNIHAALELRPIYVFENGVFEFDPAERTVTELLRPPVNSSIRNIARLGDDRMVVFLDNQVLVHELVNRTIGRGWAQTTTRKQGEEITLEMLTQSINVQIPGAEPLASISIPEGVYRSDGFFFGVDADLKTAWFDCPVSPLRGGQQVVRLDLASNATTTFDGDIHAELGKWESATVASAAVITPLAAVASIFGFEEIRYLTTGRSLIALIVHHWPSWLLMSGTILVVSAFFWQFVGKHYAVRFGIDRNRQWRWTLMGLLLGPAGLLALLTAYHCPGRTRCSGCNRRRVVTRELCEHCNAPFPAPEQNGTEILSTSAQTVA